jgi:NADPH-dependent curcumin reductase CurA
MSDMNRQYLLKSRPVGLPKDSDFEFVTLAPVPPAEGEVQVAIEYMSLDPAMRGWMNDGKSYVPPIKLGAVMRALAVGRVVESKDSGFKAGDYVSGAFGIQSIATVPAKECTKIDINLAPLPTYLNILGMTGMTAYFGLLEVGEPKEGDTVVVSAASGAVGATVGQIAKIKGCHVVGLAGGPEKCRYLTEVLGYDVAIDYKSENVSKALRAACPKGIDVYFDNVGGEILEACLSQINLHARIVICGAISQYNATEPPKGPANYLSLLVNRARMQGMIVFDYAARYGVAAKDMAGWMKDGKLKGKEDIVEGIETFPKTLLKLFSGENFGKLILKV